MPLVAAIKAYAPKRTGALRESIGAIVKTNKRTGDTFAVVGPRRGYYRGGAIIGKGADGRGADVPANYAHLVEFGHHAVTPKKGTTRRKKTATSLGFIAAKPFMRPALTASRSAVGDELVKGVKAGLEAALKRIVKNPSARG
jgi:HK97 gp10 family phage protein